MFKRIFLLLFLSIFISLYSISFAHAETVYVKYRGSISLDNFKCKNTISSFVNRICYQKKNDYLIVLLSSTYYHYCKVPNNVFKSWVNSSSKGRFYNSNIKGRFDCRLGGIPK
jgi:hypothetical protein